MVFIRTDDDTTIFAEDTGGSGKPVLFIHGWPLSHKMFEYQFIQMQKSGYRCIGIDLRGFGKSDKPWGKYNYDIFAEDIKRVIIALNLQEVTLVGFSMGGAIAMRYVGQYFSEVVSKVVFMGAAAPCFTKRDDFPYGLEKSDCDNLISKSNQDRPKMISDFGKIFFSKESGAVSNEMSAWLHALGMEASPYATVRCLEELRDADLRKDMRIVQDRKILVAIFHGIHDKICPFDLAKVMNKGIAGSRLIEFKESGHGLNIEQRERTNEELMRFIG